MIKDDNVSVVTHRARRLTAAASVVVLAAIVVPTRSAQATPLDDLRAKVTAAQAAADAATARWTEAENELGTLETQITALQGEIATGRAEVARLKVVARGRAVKAYVNRGIETESLLVFDGNPLAEARRRKLLDKVNAEDDASMARLETLTADLDVQQRDLSTRREQQRALVEKLQVEQGALDSQLRQAQQAQTAYENFVKQLAEAQAAAERARVAAEKQRRIAATVTSGGGSGGGGATGGYTAGGIVCPVRGAVSFVDSWGAPRSDTGPHQGVDMMAARGTPDVAVVSGNVVQKDGAISGLGVRLYGDDGNLYYYFHLDAYGGRPGTSRRVRSSATSATPATRAAVRRTRTSRSTRAVDPR